LFDRKILIFMTSLNWKKFAHLHISPQTNGEMKNEESKIMEGGAEGGRKGKPRQNQRQNGKSVRVTKSDGSVGIRKGRTT